jgi:uncharacterized membrane protein
MKINKYWLVVTLIVTASFVIGLVFYPRMPETMASHWNARGEADGYMAKFWVLFLMPFISLALAIMMYFIPKIDPLKTNIEKFKGYFYGFVIVMLLFFFYVHTLVILWNLDFRFDFTQLLMPAMAVLMYFVGILTAKAKRNYFIGIRTPWTLNNDEVWDKTHKLGGKLFKIAGVLTLFGVFFPDQAIIILMISVLGAALTSVVYSYLVFRQIQKGS